MTVEFEKKARCQPVSKDVNTRAISCDLHTVPQRNDVISKLSKQITEVFFWLNIFLKTDKNAFRKFTAPALSCFTFPMPMWAYKVESFVEWKAIEENRWVVCIVDVRNYRPQSKTDL